LQHLRSPRRARSTRFILVLASFTTLAIGATSARANPSDVATVSAEQSKPQQLPAWLKKMAGSSVEVGNYIGSGSFYTSGYRDPYVSTSIYIRPNLDLGTRFKLALSARFYFENEWTLPDNPVGRHFYPYDGWLSLVARELKRWSPAKLTLGGTVRFTVPISYESRYANLWTAATAGLSLGGELTFGHNPVPEKQFKFTFALIGQFTKYVHSVDIRGNAGGASSGCRPVNVGSVASGTEGPATAESDRCGGPYDPDFGFRSAGVLGLARGKWSLGMTLLIDNTFLYYVSPDDGLTSPNAVNRGREDSTWGIVGLTYAINDHFAANAGVSSQQPALNSRLTAVRFPFFDFSGANANNFTQAFVSLTGSL